MQHDAGCAVNILVRLLSEQHPLCAACLSAKSGLGAGDVMITLTRLLATIYAERKIGGRCRACSQWTLVYSLCNWRTRRERSA